MNDDLLLTTVPYVRDKGNIYPYGTKVGILINFERDITTLKYYSYGDIFSKLGGLKASLGPILGFITPLIALNFLIKLTAIIQANYTNSYEKELS